MLKFKRENVYLVGDNPLLTIFCLYLFFIHFILIPLQINIVLYSLPFTIIYSLVNDGNNCYKMLMGQITNSSNRDGCNLVIIDDLNVYMPGWGYIYNSIILIRNSPIRTPIDQWLVMCEIVFSHIYKWSVNLEIQFSINSEILSFLCGRLIGTR